MSRTFKLILSAFGCLTSFIASAETSTFFTDTVTMSLDSCIAVALSENPTIHIADMEITRMDYSKRKPSGSFFPPYHSEVRTTVP